MLGVAALIILQQAVAGPEQAAGANPHQAALPTTATRAYAVRAARPPVIDGRDDDPVWRLALPIGPFLEWQPTEGRASRFRTEAKVAYDAANLYVFIRSFDPHPDSIIRRLDRRDTFGPSDRVGLMVDAYHDRRSGYEFWVNASGVKMDAAIFDDKEDGAWDGVWDVATRIDSLGWTAEFRIPLSQLRYPVQPTYTFGILLMRDIYRYSERTAWPRFSQAKAGLVMQFGEVTGIEGLEAPRRLEAAPYVVAKDASVITGNAFQRASRVSVGGDLKYRVASNLTLDATVNPDFGQVEADPAVLNLSAYESFFAELRPFFVAGRGVFRFDVNCNDVNCNNEGLYYSRRVGRTPQLAGANGDTTPQQPTTILGAAKLTGRLPGGLAIGLMDAVTQRDQGWFGDTLKTVEPATNFALLRLKQDLRNGASSVGGMVTAVNRSLDAYSSPYLDRSAYAGAVDFRHRFPKDMYEISGSFDVSRVEGSAAAMTAIQTDAVHYYQRPDAGLPLDRTRTALGGDAEEFRLDKVGGDHIMFETAYQRRSAGFEINDLGYLQRADQQSWSTWVGYFDRHVTRLSQQFQWNMNWWQNWTTAGLPQERALNTNLHVTLRNHWGIGFGGTVGQLGTTYDDRAARGGPAMRQNPYLVPWVSIGGDDRRALVPYLSIQTAYLDAGHTHTFHLSPELDWKVASRFNSALSLQYVRNVNDIQWYGNFTDAAGVTHYTFAHLPQTTVSLTLRLNYTFTPNISLQVYAQPFVSKGTYSNVRELSATPRAASYDDRYQAYGDTSVTNHPGGFNFKEFQSNVVFRWEYRPGSTLFVVWNEGRRGSVGTEGTNDFQGDVRELFGLHPMNTFLVKMSYWLNW
jgi:hypothetical protein